MSVVAPSSQPCTAESLGSVDAISEYVVDNDFVAAEVSLPLAGVWSGDHVVDVEHDTSDGWKAPSYETLFYHRIWIIPRHIQLGNVTSDRIDEVEVWNAFFEARHLYDLEIIGDDTGLTLSGEIDKNFNRLESEIRTLTVDLIGAGNINVEYHFLWDGDGDIAAYLLVDGQRVIPFKLRHNWAENILEQIAYKTDVMVGTSGKEQRVRLRQLPRRRIEMSYLTLTPEERMYLENILYGQNLTFSIPMWQDVTKINIPILANETVFSVDTVGRDFEIGAYIFLRSGDTTEALQIADFTVDEITTAEGTANAYPNGAQICPARFGQLETKLQLDRLTSQIEKLKLAWVLNADQHRANQFAEYDFDTYRDLEVYAVKNDYASAQGIEQETVVTNFDSEVGLIGRRTDEPFPRRIYPFRTLIERDELPKFLQWLENRAGRLTPFWFNDRVEAFRLVDSVGVDSVNLVMQNNGYTQFAFGSAARQDIAIKLTDGSWLYRRIIAAVDNNDGTETITLDEAPGVELDPDDKLLISYLRCVRLSSDQIELVYETSNVIRTSAPFTDLLTN